MRATFLKELNRIADEFDWPHEVATIFLKKVPTGSLGTAMSWPRLRNTLRGSGMRVPVQVDVLRDPADQISLFIIVYSSARVGAALRRRHCPRIVSLSWPLVVAVHIRRLSPFSLALVVEVAELSSKADDGRPRRRARHMASRGSWQGLCGVNQPAEAADASKPRQRELCFKQNSTGDAHVEPKTSSRSAS